MKRSLFALALAAVLPLSAQAGELSYNYVQLDYTRASIDDVDADPDGFTLKGSAALGDRFYLFGSYLKGNDSIDGLDLDYDQTQIGFGFRRQSKKTPNLRSHDVRRRDDRMPGAHW